MSEWPSWVNVARDVHDMTSDPRNRCAVCGRVCAVGFVAPDDLWQAAAGEYEHDHLCIACFDERVPDDWPVQWESVTTLWPVSRKRALTDLAEHDHRRYKSRSTCPICIETVAEARAAAERDVAGEPRWPSGPDAERELAAALRSQIWGEGAQSGLNRLEDARAILAALQEKRDPGE